MLIRQFQARTFAAQASPKVAGKVSELQITTLPNQTVVATIDGNSPNAHVAVAYRYVLHPQ